MRHRLLREIFSTLEKAEPAYPEGPIDEYRALAALANAWERYTLTHGLRLSGTTANASTNPNPRTGAAG